jgi:integrase
MTAAAMVVADRASLAIGGDLLEAAQANHDAARASNTRRAYAGDWARFATWCDGAGVVALPADPRTVALYAAHLARLGRKPATIRRALVTVSQAHREAGHDAPTLAAVVRNQVKGIVRRAAEHGHAAPKKAPAVSPEQVGAMVAACGEGLRGVRDRAMLLLGFGGAFRRAELVALDVSDLRFVPQGLEVTVRRSKTDQTGEGHVKAIAKSAHPERCPVLAVRAWLEAAGIVAGAVFPELATGDVLTDRRSAGRTVDRALKRAAERAGLGLAVSAHSLRAGFITSARRAGHRPERIRAISGHKDGSRVFEGYIREADVWAEHAGAGVL